MPNKTTWYGRGTSSTLLLILIYSSKYKYANKEWTLTDIYKNEAKWSDFQVMQILFSKSNIDQAANLQCSIGDPAIASWLPLPPQCLCASVPLPYQCTHASANPLVSFTNPLAFALTKASQPCRVFAAKACLAPAEILESCFWDVQKNIIHF